MESTLSNILNLIHEREAAIKTELVAIDQAKRLLAPKGGAKDTGKAPEVAAANGDADAIPEVGGSWSAARRKRHSLMMKKRWAARKRKA